MTNIPKLCAIDIDGTLVGPDKTISSENIAGIARYVKAGGTVILSSGRMHSSMLKYCDELGLPGDNIILSYNGAMAKTLAGDLLFERPVSPDFATEIVEYCQEHSMHLNFYYNDDLYVQALGKWSQLYFNRTGSVPIAVGGLSKFYSKAPTKLLICDDKVRLDPLVPYFVERFAGQLYVTKTDDEYLEFMADGVDKGSGLEWVCKRLGVAQEDTIAFGDSYNDVQMISWAGTGIAMSNGRDAARSAADYSADNSNWSAVGTELNRIVG